MSFIESQANQGYSAIRANSLGTWFFSKEYLCGHYGTSFINYPVQNRGERGWLPTCGVSTLLPQMLTPPLHVPRFMYNVHGIYNCLLCAGVVALGGTPNSWTNSRQKSKSFPPCYSRSPTQLCHEILFLQTHATSVSFYHRVGKGRGEIARISLPSQLERTTQLGWWGLHRVHLLLCPVKNFRHGNKKNSFPCNGVFISDIIMYVKLWTNFKINMLPKYSCLAMASVCPPYHRGSTQSSDMAWHWWLTSQNVKNKGSCSWQKLAAEQFCSNLGYDKPF